MTLNVRSSISLILVVMGILLSASARAQEIPRPSLSRAGGSPASFSRPYNLKIGPIALTANAGLGITFVDNVSYSDLNKEGDIILNPTLGITGVWQVTKLNNLDLKTTLGYTKYLQHPELDTQTALVSPDSAIRLNLFVGDFKIVLHEQFSLQEDPITDGGVSGVATLGRFTNTIGVSVLWDLNDVIWSLGYDHLNFIPTGKSANANGTTNGNLSTLDHSVDQVSTAVMLKLTPTTRLGVEATAGFSRYPNNPGADATNLSIGPYLDVQLTRYTQFILGAGYQLYSSENRDNSGTPREFIATPGGLTPVVSSGNSGGSGSRNQTGDGSSYYFNLAISHRLNSAYSERLTLGRDFQIGLLSDRTEVTFVNYSSQWTISRRFSLSSSLYFENARQTGQGVRSSASSQGDYQRVGATLNTGYQLSKKLAVNLSYQYTRKLSDAPSLQYSQNRFSILFGYQF